MRARDPSLEALRDPTSEPHPKSKARLAALGWTGEAPVPTRTALAFQVVSSSLGMTKPKTLLHYRGILVGEFFFVGVDFAVIFGVERAMLCVELPGRHG